MAQSNTVIRSLHDLSLATWFGGTLMGSVGLEGAARAEGETPSERIRIAAAGWWRFGPLTMAAVGVHLASGAALTRANAARVIAQQGVGSVAGAKAALTLAAAGATAVSAWEGQRQARSVREAPSELEGDSGAGQEPSLVLIEQGPLLRALRWSVPLLTGIIIVLNARMSEQQRPAQVAQGVVRRLLPSH